MPSRLRKGLKGCFKWMMKVESLGAEKLSTSLKIHRPGEAMAVDEIRAIPEAYREPCPRGGRLEKAEISGFPYALVYLPAGYDDSEERYCTFWLIHGGGGDQYSFFQENGAFKNIRLISKFICRNFVPTALWKLFYNI